MNMNRVSNLFFLYTQGQIRTNSNSSQDSTEMLDVVETRLLAMERVSVLFERFVCFN